jgi:flagellin
VSRPILNAAELIQTAQLFVSMSEIIIFLISILEESVMPVINTNLSALIAQNAARASETQSAQSMERLSTGLRINSAKDDAAGLAIATRMTSAIRGLGMSLKNASDGISMAQTAEGALGNITDALQRLRELAVQSANGSYSNTERSFLDSESTGLVAEIARIGAQTNFNNTKLLNGTFGFATFQLGYLAADSMVFGGIKIPKLRRWATTN